MLLGPVFRAELLRASRRRRFYATRAAYGLLLLSIIGLGYESRFSGAATATIDEVARFASSTFVTFAVVQLVAILLLIPALFGGAIADEKQRKTLHYLMASRLSSLEIVVDKVLARAAHLTTFLGVGLPVVSLLGLFGGVPPGSVILAYVGTTSTAAFGVALTVLVSTLARKVRQAVLIAYILILGWQLAPPIVGEVGSRLYPAAYAWVGPINDWVGLTCPLQVYVLRMTGRGGFSPPGVSGLIGLVGWMVGLQLGGAALMIALAVWRLRPTFRRHAEARPRRGWFADRGARGPRARRRWWGRPACGSDAMAWKERHFARTDAFTRAVVLPATVLVSTFLILAVGIDETLLRAVVDFWRGGPRAGAGGEAFVDQIRAFSAWYVAIWLLAVAGASASSVAVEREEDTWVSLTSTPLAGREILRGKALGALWAQRGFAAVPLGLWTVGLLTGAVHPLGFLGAVLMFGLATGLVASVGLHASLRAATTSKALASTIATLAVLSGYPGFVLWSFVESGVWDGYYAAYVGLPARLAVGPLASYAYVSETWATATTGGFDHLKYGPHIRFGLGLAFVYALAAGTFAIRAVVRFDAWLDRPRITVGPGPAREPVRPSGVAGPALHSRGGKTSGSTW